MTRLIISLLFLCLFSIPVFAGAYVPTDAPLLITPPTSQPEKVIIRQIVMQVAKDIKPLHGLTLGFINDYPTLGYSTKDNFIETSIKNVNGNVSAIIRVGGIAASPGITLPKYAQARVGLAINAIPNQIIPGIFAGIENYLDERTVIYADACIWAGGGYYAYPTVSAGVKIIL